MKNIWMYLVMIALTIYVEIMYDDFEGIAFLAFEILLLVFLLILGWLLKRKVSLEMKIPIPVIQKGQEVRVELLAKNRGILPVSKLRIWLKAEYELQGGEEKEQMKLSVGSRSTKRAYFYAEAGYCGRIRFYVPKARVCDYLGLTSWRIRYQESQYVNVLPEFHEIETQVSIKTRNFSEDGEEYDPHKSGEDSSEIFQLREFRNGDSMQRIHWKLSARSEELIVREFARPVSLSVLLLADLSIGGRKEEILQRMDAVIELVAAVSFSLWQAQVPHCVAWFDEKQGGLVRKSIRREEQVYEMIDEFLRVSFYQEKRNMKELYKIQRPKERFSTEILLDSQLCLSVNEDTGETFDAQHLREQLAGYLLEV